MLNLVCHSETKNRPGKGSQEEENKNKNKIIEKSCRDNKRLDERFTRWTRIIKEIQNLFLKSFLRRFA